MPGLSPPQAWRTRSGFGTGLASFASTHPLYARWLCGTKVREREFAARLHEHLDRLVRAQVMSRPLLRAAAAMDRLSRTEYFDYFINCLVADAAAATMERTRRRALRSLWGTTPIISMKCGAQADRLAGMVAETLVHTTYHVTADFDIVLTEPERWFNEHAPELLGAYRRVLLCWALLSYDAFFFFNDQGLLPAGGYGDPRFGISLEEMRLIRASGKSLYTLAYGADYRVRSKTFVEGAYNLCMDCPEIGKYCICDEERAEAVFTKIKTYANAVVGCGLSLSQLPAPRRVDYLAIDVDRIEPQYPNARPGRPLRVVHATNHAFFKGSRYLEAVVEQLRADGVAVEMRLLSGISADAVRDAMREADVVADQFISGSFGYAAIEAMALGKPVLCYIGDVVLPDRANLPIINVNPDALYATLKRLADDPSGLSEIGRKSREYVELNYSIQALAEQLLDLYRQTSTFGKRLRMRLPAVVTRLSTVARVGLVRSMRAARISWDRVREQLPLWRQEFVAKVRAWRADPGAGTRRLLRRSAKWLVIRALSRPVPLPVGAGALASRVRFALGRPRSLWGITPILTLPLLARADRAIGLRSDSVVFTTYHISSRFDISVKRFNDWIIRDHPKLYGNFCRLVFAWALLRYDIFHFFCDRGLMLQKSPLGINEDEMKALRAAGKRLYTYAYGADVRTREATKAALPAYNYCMDCPAPKLHCICDDKLGQENIATISKYANAMLAMGDMKLYIPGCKEFSHWPVDMARIGYVGVKADASRALRVAHAPNHSFFKGSKYLDAAVARLRREGFPIELVSVTGVPNSEVLRLFGEADIIADQFVGGMYGYTAFEAMARGKPVLCYVADQTWLLAHEECPIVHCTVESLYDVLKDMVNNRERLPAIGAQGREYIRKYHSIEAVARRLGALYLQTANFPAATRARIRKRSDALRGFVE